MSTVRIPVDSVSANFTLRCELDAVEYEFTFRFNERDGTWFMSLADIEGDPIVEGVPLRVNLPLLMDVPDVRKPGGLLMALDTSGTGVDPGRYDLGDRVVLTYGDGT